MMKNFILNLFWISALVILLSSCCHNSKCNVSPDTGANLTVAQTIEGSFSGSGKYMPGNIKLGTYNTCQEPAWASYQKSGNASAVVSVVNDSTVNVKLTGSIYANSFNKNYIVRRNGNVIESKDIAYASSNKVITYYISTKSLNVVLRSSYIVTSSCLQFSGYFYSSQGITATPPYTNYNFTSLEVFEFTGNK